MGVFRPYARGLAAVVLLLLLAACGFRPLYGTSNESVGVQAALASIAIPEPDTRLAQIIRNDLISAMSPPGRESSDDYTLLLQAVSSESSSIDTKTEGTARKTVRVNASFELVERRSGQIVARGKTFSQVSYDRTQRSFSDVQGQANALERAAHEVSVDIRTRLAAHFASS